MHVLLIGLLFNDDRQPRAVRVSESRGILFLLESPPELPARKPELGPSSDVGVRKKSRPQVAVDVPPSQGTSDDTAIMPTAKSPVDWYVEGKRVAREVVARALEKETRKCTPEDDPKSLLPKCMKEPRYHWDPAPGKLAGKLGFMKQLLPYAGGGKRCFASREFTGCVMMGKPPEPDDQRYEYLSLYEYFKHPNRPHSSVPDVDEINRPLPSKPPPAEVKP